MTQKQKPSKLGTGGSTMRDRLIELIQSAVGGCARHWAEIIADHLIANGVIVPPYEVVRCVGCDKTDGIPNHCGNIWCDLHRAWFDIDGFCSYGSRRGDV